MPIDAESGPGGLVAEAENGGGANFEVVAADCAHSEDALARATTRSGSRLLLTGDGETARGDAIWCCCGAGSRVGA